MSYVISFIGQEPSMLERLLVRNYVLIDHLDLDFSQGFSVFTGETGSGKSIMLGALSLLLGAKADKDAVRRGEESAEISGIFTATGEDVENWLHEHEIAAEDDEIIIRRTIKANGRSSYSINGSPVTRTEGEELGQLLVDISSQHAHQSLMKTDVLRKLVDKAASADQLFSEYKAVYKSLKAKEKEREKLSSLISSASEENDYMAYCLKELDEAELHEGEDDDIRARLSVINSSEFLKETLSSLSDELRASSESLSQSLMLLRKAEKKDAALSSLAERLESLSIECDDILLSVREHLSSIDYSEEELEAMNARLSVLQKIKRRFGPGLSDAIRRREEYREKLRLSDDGAERLQDIEGEIRKLSDEAGRLSEAITEKRRETASSLSSAIKDNLHKLGMPSAEFVIRITPSGQLREHGADDIEFLIAPNKGEKLSPVQNTASGGELSRIMLSLKAALKAEGDVDIFIFDEIDTGIGGAVANAVGDELLELSRSSQVIAITHLPQIAVRASSHFLVYKQESDGRTVSHIRRIDGEERVEETARLLSGDASGIAIEHARKLLEVQG